MVLLNSSASRALFRVAEIMPTLPAQALFGCAQKPLCGRLLVMSVPNPRVGAEGVDDIDPLEVLYISSNCQRVSEGTNRCKYQPSLLKYSARLLTCCRVGVAAAML